MFVECMIELVDPFEVLRDDLSQVIKLFALPQLEVDNW
jgi:hypothetical protein